MSLIPEDEEAVRQFIAWKHRARDAFVKSDGLMPPQAVYTEMMKAIFAPALRSVGFRGSNGRFQLPNEVYWALLGFQKSSFSGADEVQFTVNLAVIDRAEWESRRADAPYWGTKPSPSAFYGKWADQLRIGQLTTPQGDKWWRIVRGADVEPVRADALSDLLGLAVPWIKERVAR